MKLFEKTWFVILLMLPFVKPPCLEYMTNLSIVDRSFDILRIISFAVIIYHYLKSGKISTFMIFLILFQGTLFISTIANHGNYWKQIVICGTIISFCMLAELCIKTNCHIFFRAVIIIYNLLIWANFLLYLIFPHGIVKDNYYGNEYHLLGIRNGLPPLFIPIMGLAVLYSAVNGKKMTLTSLSLLLCITITTIITWSATGVVGWFFMTVYIIFIYRSRLTAVFNSLFLYLLYALAFISIVLLRLQYYFSYIIEDVLHKNITFTGRTDIWDISINLIKRSPIIGYGVYEGHGFVFYRGQYYYSHNAILEILIQGGAIALIFFIAMLVVSCISLYRHKNNHISGIITFTVFTLLSMMIMEAYLSYIWTFGILTVSCCVGDIIRQMEELPSQNKASTNSTRLRYIRYRMSR